MMNRLRTLPAALALVGGFLWFGAAPAAQADCYTIRVCVSVNGSTVCGWVTICI